MMKKQKKVSSFLLNRRRERMNLSLGNGELDSSIVSALNGSEVNCSLTERSIELSQFEYGSKTERLAIETILDTQVDIPAIFEEKLQSNKNEEIVWKRRFYTLSATIAVVGVLVSGLLWKSRSKLHP
jgi:hypothetical protein